MLPFSSMSPDAPPRIGYSDLYALSLQLNQNEPRVEGSQFGSVVKQLKGNWFTPQSFKLKPLKFAYIPPF